MKFLLCTIIALLVGFLLIAEFNGCRIQGTEFSPDNFLLRDFEFRQSPFSKIIRGKLEQSLPYSNCSSIQSQSFITSTSTTANRDWDLVSDNTLAWDDPYLLSGDFDARFLVHYLDSDTDQWNIENPEMAKILWPEIAFLAKNDLYLLIPEILENVLSRDLDLDQFKMLLLRQLKLAYTEAAKLAEINDDEMAKKWSQKAKDFTIDSLTIENIDFKNIPAESPVESP